MEVDQLTNGIAHDLKLFRSYRYENPAKVLMHPAKYLLIRMTKRRRVFPITAQLTPVLCQYPDGGAAYTLSVYGVPVEIANIQNDAGYQLIARTKPQPEDVE